MDDKKLNINEDIEWDNAGLSPADIQWDDEPALGWTDVAKEIGLGLIPGATTKEFFGEKQSPVAKALITGLRGQELGKYPRNVPEFLLEQVPASAGRLAVGLPAFFGDVGKLVWNTAQTVTDPLALLAQGESERALRSVKHDVPALAQQAGQLASGVIEQVGMPFGIRLFTREGEKFLDWDRAKTNWLTRPFETLLGAALLLEAKRLAKGEGPEKVQAETKTPEAPEATGGFSIDNPVINEMRANIEKRIEGLKKSKERSEKGTKTSRAPKLSDAEIEKLVKEEMKEALSRSERDAIQAEIDARADIVRRMKEAEAAEAGILGKPTPETALTAAEATKAETARATKEALMAGIKELEPKRPVLSAEESAKVFETLEGKMQELDALVRRIKEEGRRLGRKPLSEAPQVYEPAVGLRKAIQKVEETKPTSPEIIQRDRQISDVVSKLEELRRLRENAEAATGMNLRAIYKPAIDEVLTGLPVDVKLSVEKELAKEGAKIEPQVAIGPGRPKPIPGRKFKNVLAGRLRKSKVKEALSEEEVAKEAERIKTLASETERALLQKLPPGVQIRQVVRDKTVNPLVSAEAFLRKGDYSSAINLANKAIDNGRALVKADGPVTESIVNEAVVKAKDIVRKAVEEAKTKAERVGPTEEELAAIERENVPIEKAKEIEELGLLDDEFIDTYQKDIEKAKKKEKVSLFDERGQDIMILRYLRDKHGAKANMIFGKLTKTGRENILNEIKRDPALYEALGGRTVDTPLRRFLKDERGFLDLSRVADLLRDVKDFFSLDVLPKTTRLDEAAASAMVQHATAPIGVAKMVDSIIANAVPKRYRDTAFLSRIKDILNKDNILDGYDVIIQRAEKAEAAGDSKAAIAWYEAAKKVLDVHDIKAYDAEVRSALKDPELVEAIKGIKAEVNPLMNDLYMELKQYDPAAPQDGRGKYFGVRTNLVTKELADRWAEADKSGERTPPFPDAANYRNPNVKQDPFDTAAKFTGVYSTDFRSSLIAVLSRRWNEVTKQRIYEALKASGTAVELPTGHPGPAKIKGHRAAAMPIERRTLLADGSVGLVKRILYVPDKLVGELRTVLETDMRGPSNPVVRILNAIQLAQLVDGIYHVKNLFTEVARAQGAGKVWKDVSKAVPFVATGDAIKTVVSAMKEIDADTPQIRREIARMAVQGLVRPEYPHFDLTKLPRKAVEKLIDKTDMKVFNEIAKYVGEADLGKLIYKVDMASRLVMNRYYDNLVKRGWIKDTHMGRIKFNNQLGNYNRRLMGYWMRQFRDIGIAPFIVAGRNFNRQGIRWVTGNPGVEALTPSAAVKMRLINLTKVFALFTIPMMLNTITTGDPGGRSGTRLGEWDLGLPPDEKGKHKTIDLMQLTGLRRGMKLLGYSATIEGAYGKWTPNEILGTAKKEFISTALHPWLGPAATTIMSSLFDWTISQYRSEYGPFRVPEGGIMQDIENLRAGLQQLNPTILYPALKWAAESLGLVEPPLVKDVDHDFWDEFLKAPESVLGFRDRGSAAYYEMTKMFRNRGIIVKETPQKQAERILRNSLYGKPDSEVKEVLMNAVSKDIITPEMAEGLWRDRFLPPVARGFKALSVRGPIYEAVKVWNKMTPEEKAATVQVMSNKIDNAWNSMSDDERDDFIKNVSPILDEIKKYKETGRFEESVVEEGAEEGAVAKEEANAVEKENKGSLEEVVKSQIESERFGGGMLPKLAKDMLKSMFPLVFPDEAKKIAAMSPAERQAYAVGDAIGLAMPLEIEGAKFFTKLEKGLASKIKGGMRFNVFKWLDELSSKFGLKKDEIDWFKKGLRPEVLIEKAGGKSISREELIEAVSRALPKIKTYKYEAPRRQIVVKYLGRGSKVLSKVFDYKDVAEASKFAIEKRGKIELTEVAAELPAKYNKPEWRPSSAGLDYSENVYSVSNIPKTFEVIGRSYARRHIGKNSPSAFPYDGLSSRDIIRLVGRHLPRKPGVGIGVLDSETLTLYEKDLLTRSDKEALDITVNTDPKVLEDAVINFVVDTMENVDRNIKDMKWSLVPWYGMSGGYPRTAINEVVSASRGSIGGGRGLVAKLIDDMFDYFMLTDAHSAGLENLRTPVKETLLSVLDELGHKYPSIQEWKFRWPTILRDLMSIVKSGEPPWKRNDDVIYIVDSMWKRDRHFGELPRVFCMDEAKFFKFVDEKTPFYKDRLLSSHVVTYTSSHWPDVSNPLFHTRSSWVSDIEGKSGLYLEEVQSDWWNAYRNDTTSTIPPVSNVQALALKKAIADTIEAGKDRVYWTTGDEIGDMWNLWKHVDHLRFRRVGKDHIDLQAAIADSSEVAEVSNIPLDRLHQYVGNRVAKIVEDKVSRGAEVFDVYPNPDEVKVGAEWARIIYDTLLPSFAKKYGGKVGQVSTVTNPSKLSLFVRNTGEEVYTGEAENLLNWLQDSYTFRISIKKSTTPGEAILRTPGGHSISIPETILDKYTGEGGWLRRWGNKAGVVADRLIVSHGAKANARKVWYMDITPKVRDKVKGGQEFFAAVPFVAGGGKREKEESGP